MYIIMTTLFILCGQILAYADSYTITTTPVQEAALAHVVTAFNTTNANAITPQPAVSQQTYLQAVVDSIFTNYQHQKEEAETAQALDLKQRYDAVSTMQRQAIDNILSGATNAPR